MATNLTDAEVASYRTPSPPLGRCVCGRHAWTEINGKPMHACCDRLGGDCEACAVSEAMDRKQELRQWGKRAAEYERSHSD